MQDLHCWRGLDTILCLTDLWETTLEFSCDITICFQIWGPASFGLHVPPPTRTSPPTASLSKPRQPVTIPIPGPVFGSHKESNTRSSIPPGEAPNRVDLCSAHDHTHDQCRLRHPEFKEYSARSNISAHVFNLSASYVKPSVSEKPRESRANSTKLPERGCRENGWQRALLQSVCRGGVHEHGQVKPAMWLRIK